MTMEDDKDKDVAKKLEQLAKDREFWSSPGMQLARMQDEVEGAEGFKEWCQEILAGPACYGAEMAGSALILLHLFEEERTLCHECKKPHEFKEGVVTIHPNGDWEAVCDKCRRGHKEADHLMRLATRGAK